jgi:hypothetical protein
MTVSVCGRGTHRRRIGSLGRPACGFPAHLCRRGTNGPCERGSTIGASPMRATPAHLTQRGSPRACDAQLRADLHPYPGAPSDGIVDGVLPTRHGDQCAAGARTGRLPTAYQALSALPGWHALATDESPVAPSLPLRWPARATPTHREESELPEGRAPEPRSPMRARTAHWTPARRKSGDRGVQESHWFACAGAADSPVRRRGYPGRPSSTETDRHGIGPRVSSSGAGEAAPPGAASSSLTVTNNRPMAIDIGMGVAQGTPAAEAGWDHSAISVDVATPYSPAANLLGKEVPAHT